MKRARRSADEEGNIDWDEQLFSAASASFVAGARRALEHGANVNCKSIPFGRTPLHFASECDNLELVHLLVENGANVHARDRLGNTPLHRAADENSINTSRLLLDNGAEIDAKDNLKWTPFQHACIKRHFEVAKLLLERGATTPFGRA